MSTTGRRRRPDDRDGHNDPKPGRAEQGEEFRPADLREDDRASSERPRAAPAPGVPVSAQKYERLKDRARRRRSRDKAPAQEDRPKKPK